MTRRGRIFLVIVLAAPVAFVAQQFFIATLGALTVIERERDSWQRPDDVLAPLALAPGRTVVDLGSGAGYFALKMAPRVGPRGRVLARGPPPALAGVPVGASHPPRLLAPRRHLTAAPPTRSCPKASWLTRC